MSEGFLRRWSRVKAASGKAPPTVKASSPTVSPPADHLAPVAPPDLPPIAELTAQSDFKPFMQGGVPAEVRGLALRHLWRSDPSLSAMDPLDLHNLDYSTPLAEPAVQSAWTAGRGYAFATPKEVEDHIQELNLEIHKPAAQLSQITKEGPSPTCERPLSAPGE